MSAFTHRVYASWKRQNSVVQPQRSPSGGMGGVPPMQAKQMPFQPSDSAGNAVMRPRTPSRPEKQKTPASATNTPGAVTNIREVNVDGTHCRP